jgi:undecaprenyl-diphosphatase
MCSTDDELRRLRFLRPTLVIPIATLIFGIMAIWVRPGPIGPDATILQALEAARTPHVTELMLAITSIGRGTITAAFVLLSAAWLLVRGFRAEALFLAVANLGSGVLSPSTKGMFSRPRPLLEMATRVTSPESFSFPSGHALSAMVLYTSLAMVAAGLGHLRLQRALIALAAVMVPTMGFTRVYLGVHYPSDVVGGWALGAVWVWLVYLGYVRLAQKAPATLNPNASVLP